MKQDDIKNVDEMIGKVIGYVRAVSDDASDYESQCLVIASKFLVASFMPDKNEACILGGQIISKCLDLAYLIMDKYGE